MLTWPDAAVVMLAMALAWKTVAILVMVAARALTPKTTQRTEPQESPDLPHGFVFNPDLHAPERTPSGFARWQLAARMDWADHGFNLTVRPGQAPPAESPSPNPDGGSVTATTP